MTIQRHQPVSIGSQGILADYPPGATYGPRVTENYELVWLLSGSARWICRRPDLELQLRPGELLLVRPGMREEVLWDPDRPSRHCYMHFTLDPTLAELVPPPNASDPDAPDDLVLTRPIIEPGPLGGLLDYLLWLGRSREQDWRERAADVVSLIIRVFACGPLPCPAGMVEPPIVTAVLNHVRDEWAGGLRPVSLDELVAATSTSRSHLGRTFREHFGMGVITLLELVRLGHAELLLARSNLQITQIARDCGFVDPLHFSRRFHHVYGCSPREFRRSEPRPMSPLSGARAAATLQRLTAPAAAARPQTA